jgi:hypothetical protein
LTTGALTLANVTVSGNTAEGQVGSFSQDGVGGGLYNFAGHGQTASLTNVTVSGNTARTSGSISPFNGDGGGIFSTSDMSLTNSTVSGNGAQGFGSGNGTFGSGGGIFNLGSSMRLTNSTVSGNTAQGVGSSTSTFGSGGGILNMGGQFSRGTFDCCAEMSLTNVTVSANLASSGGGIFNAGNCCGTVSSTPTLNLTSTIVAKQVSGADCLPTGPITSLGYNLDSDSSCTLTAAGDLPNTNPLLDPLALNSPGNTQTHALQAGSPAIDHIPPGVNGCGTTVSTDQRGVSRPQGSGCDIGAYELLPATPTPMPTPIPVGGIVALPVSGSGSGSSTLLVDLVGGAVLTALLSGWYIARRRRI